MPVPPRTGPATTGLDQGKPTTGGRGDRPRIRHNDYSPLVPPPLGGWEPELPVSVVIPAHGGQHRLDLTLAALAAQTYPAGLLEVIVVDDGSEPPLRLPHDRPENTRLVPAAPGGWGTAHALNTGAAQAEGAVIQRLDSDMVICREHIEALARWHHLTDYVVTIGAKVFLDEPPLTAARVRAAVAAGELDSLFDMAAAIPSSTEATIRRLDGLRTSKNPYHVCTGPTVSLRRDLFRAAGGLDPAVLRGEDTEFAYRLAMRGPSSSPTWRPGPFTWASPPSASTATPPCAWSRPSWPSGCRCDATCARSAAGAGWSPTSRSCWTPPAAPSRRSARPSARR